MLQKQRIIYEEYFKEIVCLKDGGGGMRKKVIKKKSAAWPETFEKDEMNEKVSDGGPSVCQSKQMSFKIIRVPFT